MPPDGTELEVRYVVQKQEGNHRGRSVTSLGTCLWCELPSFNGRRRIERAQVDIVNM